MGTRFKGGQITRPRSIDRTRMAAIASLPREGRVQRAVRRCFIASDGAPRCAADLLRWAYPELEHYKRWHRWSVRRAVLRYAVPIGRANTRGRPIIWSIR